MNRLRDIIANLSAAFAKGGRVSLILFVAIVAFGYLSYTTLLTREGFPAVQFPIGFVQTNYFVEDAEQVNEEVTRPLEVAISDIEEVTSISSTTTGNFSTIVVEFEADLTSEEGMDLVREKVEQSVSLPEASQSEFNPVDAGAVDGTNDLLFSISGDKTTTELEAKAEEISNRLIEQNVIIEANPINLTGVQTNPQTGEEFEVRESFNRYGYKDNGDIKFDPAISIGVIKKDNVGAVELSEAVREIVDEMEEDGELSGYQVSYAGDLANTVNDQISSLENSAFTGLLAVIVVLFLFVNWRASVVTAVFMPIVMAATFIGLYLIGYTLNVISLFGLILVLGLFVDDAIVVVEAIDYQKKLGLKGIKAVKAAIKNISVADISGTITTVLVFIPMAAISGILGEFIRPIPITVILALSISVVVALTVGVYFSNIILADKKAKSSKDRTMLDNIINLPGRLNNVLGNYVSSAVRLYTSNAIGVIIALIVSIGVIAGGSFFGSRLDFSVFPAVKDADEIIVNISYPEGTAIAQADETAQEVEEIIANTNADEINQVDYYGASESSATILLTLTDMGDRDVKAPEIADKLNNRFSDLEAATVEASVSSAGPPSSDFHFQMQIFSEDTEKLESASEDIKSFIEDYDPSNQDVQIEEVVVTGLEVISKDDSTRFASVQAKLSDEASTGDVVELRDSVQEEYTDSRLEQYGLTADDLGFDLGQETDNLESFNSTFAAIGFALVAMYALLVMQFSSFTQPLLIFLAIPFTFPGFLPGLYLTDNPLSFFVMIGVIGLIGIVVNNSIMLLDYANQLREEGKGIRDAIVEAVRVRFRPLVTTSATTVVGLLPLAVSDPFWEALSFTIIFGLIASTTLVIFSFPVFYVILEKLRSFTPGFIRRILEPR
jgi:multidrug efflux pump subunit AcrB